MNKCLIYFISTEATIIIQGLDFLPIHPGIKSLKICLKTLLIILLWSNLIKKPRKPKKNYRWIWPYGFWLFDENDAFFRPNRIKASVIDTQSARVFLSELNIEKNEQEKKFKADVNQKAFFKVMQQSLSQKRMKEAGTASKNKRTFKKIGKNLVLLKLFSRQPQMQRPSFLLSEPEERFILW